MDSNEGNDKASAAAPVMPLVLFMSILSGPSFCYTAVTMLSLKMLSIPLPNDSVFTYRGLLLSVPLVLGPAAVFAANLLLFRAARRRGMKSVGKYAAVGIAVALFYGVLGAALCIVFNARIPRKYIPIGLLDMPSNTSLAKCATSGMTIASLTTRCS